MTNPRSEYPSPPGLSALSEHFLSCLLPPLTHEISTLLNRIVYLEVNRIQEIPSENEINRIHDSLWFRFVSADEFLEVGLHASMTLEVVGALQGKSPRDQRYFPRPMTPWEQGIFSFFILRLLSVVRRVCGISLCYQPVADTWLKPPLGFPIKKPGIIAIVVTHINGIGYPVRVKISSQFLEKNRLGKLALDCHCGLNFLLDFSACRPNGLITELIVEATVVLTSELAKKISVGDTLFPEDCLVSGSSTGETGVPLFLVSPEIKMAARIKKDLKSSTFFIDSYVNISKFSNITCVTEKETIQNEVEVMLVVLEIRQTLPQKSIWHGTPFSISQYHNTPPVLTRLDGVPFALLQPLMLGTQRGFTVTKMTDKPLDNLEA